MQIIFECPSCLKRTVCHCPEKQAVQCQQCEWQRSEGEADFDGDYCKRCRICGCDDLWRQKDFPPVLGLTMVGLAIVLSTIAWWNHRPAIALGVLMAFALVDMLLYTFMTDMLVCYRCRARHRKTAMEDSHPGFNLEVSERYVQMKKRQEAVQHSSEK